MELLTTLGLVVPAGLNAYIPLLAVALAERFGLLELRAPYDLIGEWWAIALIAVLLVVEIVADKVPAVDHANDVVQTVMRPAAGGLIAVSTAPGARLEPVVLVVAGILIAGSVHAVKSAARPAMNATTGGLAAPIASFFEDLAAAVTSILAIVAPVLMVIVLAAMVALVARWYLRWRSTRAAAASNDAGGGGPSPP